MSVVYRAQDQSLEREVAIKVLHPHLARDPDSRERFSREAKAVARLAHRNIPEIHDFSSADEDFTYLVSELVSGASLARLVKGEMPLPEIGVMMAVGVASALSHAHEHDIIHRDVKPENILVGKDGVVKLTDFGIAQILGLESMTVTGTLVGSPAHMAPEQIEGLRRLDARADVWALGTVLYVVATNGRLPFDASTPHGVLKRILDGRFEDPRRLNPHVDGLLYRIIERCLTLEPEGRYANVADLRDDLVAWLEDRGVEDCEDGIRRWMADSAAYEVELSLQLIQRLHESAQAWIAEGKSHEALGAYGRILLLDEADKKASGQVRSLRRGLKIKRLLSVALATLVLGGVALVGVALVLGPSDERPDERLTRVSPSAGKTGRDAVPVKTEPAKEDTAPKAPTVARKKRVPPVKVNRGPGTRTGQSIAEWCSTARAMYVAHKAATQHKLRIQKSIEDRPVGVRITAWPIAVEVEIKGRKLTRAETVFLRPGSHRAILRHRGCKQCLPDVQPFRVKPSLSGKGNKHFLFRYKPSQLVVTCPGGQVFVDGKLAGKCNQTIEVPAITPDPSTHTVTVKVDGGSTHRKKRIFRTGQRVTLKFN